MKTANEIQLSFKSAVKFLNLDAVVGHNRDDTPEENLATIWQLSEAYESSFTEPKQKYSY